MTFIRFLMPGGNRVTPLDVARVLAFSYDWPLFVACLLVIIAGSVSGTGLADALLQFISEAAAALTPLSVIVLGHWLTYLYLYSVVVSFADFIGHGNALACLSFLAIWSWARSIGIRTTTGMPSSGVAPALAECIPGHESFRRCTRNVPTHVKTEITSPATTNESSY